MFVKKKNKNNNVLLSQKTSSRFTLLNLLSLLCGVGGSTEIFMWEVVAVSLVLSTVFLKKKLCNSTQKNFLKNKCSFLKQ